MKHHLSASPSRLLSMLWPCVLAWPLCSLALDQNQTPVRTSSASTAHLDKGSLAQPATSPEMIAGDLQKIVVLCATGQYSPELDQAWHAYLKLHYRPGEDIDGMIHDISRRAQAWRDAMYQQPAPGESRQLGTVSNVMKKLHETAKAAIQNMR